MADGVDEQCGGKIGAWWYFSIVRKNSGGAIRDDTQLSPNITGNLKNFKNILQIPCQIVWQGIALCDKIDTLRIMGIEAQGYWREQKTC